MISDNSTGFKHEAAEALAQGHKVVATAHKFEMLKDVVEKYLETRRDVTKRDEVETTIDAATKLFGPIAPPQITEVAVIG